MPITFKRKFLIALIGFFLFLSGCVRIDESMKIFFPKSVNELQLVQSEFGAFWWNFVLIEPSLSSRTEPDFVGANKLCNQLKSRIDQELRLVICNFDAGSAEKVLKTWAHDKILREPFISKNTVHYTSALNSSLIQISMISDPKLLNLIRNDPFQEWQNYADLAKNSLIDSFKRQNGFLIDEKKNLIVIPIQFQVSPSVEHAKPILEMTDQNPQSFLLGAHGSTFRNENQVRNDLDVVSVISGVVFIALLVFLALKSRLRIVLLAIPVGLAVYFAALLTQWIDGSIHGLTLAFGSGIIGLALDYGLHGAFGSESKQTWTSNFVGLMTTLCGVLILIFSGIPLIRQMMVFSAIGLGLGFVFYYLVFRYFSTHFKIQSFNFYLPQIPYSRIAVGILVVLGFWGLSRSEISLDLRKLSFISEKESDQMTNFFGRQNIETYLVIRSFEDLGPELFSEKSWADQHKIEFEGVSKYLPALELQTTNAASWQTEGCDFFKKQSANIQKLFLPYIDFVCKSAPSHDLELVELLRSKSYLSHLMGTQHVLSIFSGSNSEQNQLIKAQYPQATSLTESIKNFSISLKSDFSWMVPLSLLLTVAILGFYYRKLKPILTAVLPFFTGMGLYFVVATFKGIDVDLISILGLIIVFGFSIDYGVFSTDVHVHGESEQEVKQVYSALSIAALTNIVGFMPMLFAGHPVLFKLGYALFFGTLGTYLGTIYGVFPSYVKDKK